MNELLGSALFSLIATLAIIILFALLFILVLSRSDNTEYDDESDDLGSEDKMNTDVDETVSEADFENVK